MHVIRARQTGSQSNTGGAKAFATGSGLHQMTAAAESTAACPTSMSKNASKAAPPSTRQLARDYAAFYGMEGSGAAEQSMDKARALKRGELNGAGTGKPPSTRAFAEAYKAFYDVENLNDGAMDHVRSLKNGTKPANTSVPRSFRIDTSVRQDPNFRANQARFHGTEVDQQDEFYKNYRAFYGGATPNLYQSNHMGAGHRNQQRTLLRNKLAENAIRILNTKDFNDGFQAKKRPIDQSAVLKESGFDASTTTAAIQKPKEEPASYAQLEAQGRANFQYVKNPKADKVTKTDPPIKNLGKLRYNIITGGLQDWY